jgi:hypothetical protein
MTKYDTGYNSRSCFIYTPALRSFLTMLSTVLIKSMAFQWEYFSFSMRCDCELPYSTLRSHASGSNLIVSYQFQDCPHPVRHKIRSIFFSFG